MSVDSEDFKMSDSFIDSYKHTLMLWKYKQKTEDKERSTERGGGAT